ncbi:MAG: prepilin-type N-terminal cleavage/methylation domain-containing protein, partial [Patescibacteria group bacterium]
MQKNKGFTLVELLVVVSIVGVLMVLGMTSYNTTLKKGRDATRRGDIKSMQTAFEQYYTNNRKYGDIEAMVESIQGGLPSDPKPSPYPGYYIQV